MSPNFGVDQRPSYLIRNDLRPGDVDAIVKLHSTLYGEEYGFDPTFEHYVAEPLTLFAESRGKNQKIWIVEKDGKLKGSVAIVRVSDVEAQLRWLLIHPELRGQGVGRLLVDKAVSFCRECGYGSIFLWTVSFLDAAANLYRSFGFKITKEKTSKVWGLTLTEERYELVLGK